jgi:hypothetical protein
MKRRLDNDYGFELPAQQDPELALREIEPSPARHEADPYRGKSLLTEMMKIERTEKRPSDRDPAEGISAGTPTGAEVLATDYEEQVGLAVECAFEKFVEQGNRVTELYGGVFCIARAPKFYV